MNAAIGRVVVYPHEAENLGELISVLYGRFLDKYGDAEVASMATAEVVERYLASRDPKNPAAGQVH